LAPHQRTCPRARCIFSANHARNSGKPGRNNSGTGGNEGLDQGRGTLDIARSFAIVRSMFVAVSGFKVQPSTRHCMGRRCFVAQTQHIDGTTLSVPVEWVCSQLCRGANVASFRVVEANRRISCAELGAGHQKIKSREKSNGNREIVPRRIAPKRQNVTLTYPPVHSYASQNAPKSIPLQAVCSCTPRRATVLYPHEKSANNRRESRFQWQTPSVKPLL